MANHVQGRVVAVCGKGGVGKTAVTTMLTKVLKSDPSTGRLLVVDADPALGLLYALGVDTDKTIGAVREKVLAAAESGESEDKELVAEELDYLILNTLKEEKDYSFIAMGHMNAKGCFCSVNDLLHEALSQLVGKFDTILIDGEAGIEQINRQVADRVNTLILVTDSSYRGLQTVRHIEGLVKDGSVPLCDRMGVLVNRVIGDKRSADELAKEFDLPVFGVIPYDEEVERFDREGKTLLDLPEDNPAIQAVKRAMAEVNRAA